MDRVEAEAIYDSGRVACVEVLLDLAGRVEQHEDRLRRLEEQTRRDSRTSSAPPSQDPPKTRAQRRAEARAKAKEVMRRDGAQRQAGGQPGHRGAGRELRPGDQVDEIVDHYPQACGGCGRRFDDEQRRPGGRFGRHQVCELPPISVICSEHRTHQLRCRHCRARTSARLPAEIAASPFGPSLQAAVVTLTARHRVSRRGIAELARDLFGVWLSTGAVDAICQRASAALAGPHCQLQDWVLDQAAVHVDETGWRTSGEGRALWTATTPGAAFLQIAEHCNREQFDALIGAFAGIVVSDRWNGYSHLDPHQRQVCWSHLQRDFRRHADGLAEQQTFGEQGLELTRRVWTSRPATRSTTTSIDDLPQRSRCTVFAARRGPRLKSNLKGGLEAPFPGSGQGPHTRLCTDSRAPRYGRRLTSSAASIPRRAARRQPQPRPALRRPPKLRGFHRSLGGRPAMMTV